MLNRFRKLFLMMSNFSNKLFTIKIVLMGCLLIITIITIWKIEASKFIKIKIKLRESEYFFHPPKLKKENFIKIKEFAHLSKN